MKLVSIEPSVILITIVIFLNAVSELTYTK